MTPHMEPVVLTAFAEYLSKARVYLEYGSGGSTVMAARNPGVAAVISVESDPGWVDKVRAEANAAHLHIDHSDIGAVGSWGSPLDDSGHRNYHDYVTRPWRMAAERSLSPDLVLVDGRFRVASFLYSLLCAPQGATVLFDDYMDRPQYHCVEGFCPRKTAHGPLAVFQVQKNVDVPALAALLLRYAQLPLD